MNVKNLLWYGGILVTLVSAISTPYNYYLAVGIPIGLGMIVYRRLKK